jgi:hypothetical protein
VWCKDICKHSGFFTKFHSTITLFMIILVLPHNKLQ